MVLHNFALRFWTIHSLLTDLELTSAEVEEASMSWT